ncbi:RDD family protein [Massilia glaciei]|nr:RDD family protein [Massilia glaciei]
MDTQNPYSPPMTDLTKPGQTAELELAGRGSRFGAALVDGIIGLVFLVPMFFVFGGWAMLTSGEMGFMTSLMFGLLGFAFFCVVHGHFLKTSGQTIGKKIVGIKIVDMNGNKPDLVTLLAKRYLSMSLISAIPGIGGLLAIVNILFIFRSDKRCVHDLIAGTQVVVA